MKRRRFVQSLIAAPAVPAVLIAQESARTVPPPIAPTAPKLETAIADDAGNTVTHFFTPPQLAALRKLGDIILPSINSAPGAAEANAAEFLDFLFPPGYSIHELGTCRMGDNSKSSVLNKWNQSHDIKNLLVVDGSSFVTGGSQNPTMTILALSMRATDHLAGQMRAGNV